MESACYISVKTALQTLRLGASLADRRRCEFRVWAPNAERVRVQLLRRGLGSEEKIVTMHREEGGYFAVAIEASAGDRYFYIVDDNKPVPDPVSRLLPEGVHGRTEIVQPNSFPWTDTNWR